MKNHTSARPPSFEQRVKLTAKRLATGFPNLPKSTLDQAARMVLNGDLDGFSRIVMQAAGQGDLDLAASFQRIDAACFGRNGDSR